MNRYEIQKTLKNVINIAEFLMKFKLFYKIMRFSIIIINFRHKYRIFIKINEFPMKLMNLQQSYKILNTNFFKLFYFKMYLKKVETGE